MRLQRRLFGICLVRFLVFKVPCIVQNWFISVLNHLVNLQNTQLNAETENQALGRLYSLILFG